MPKHGSATWPESKDCAPGAQQHLLPKPANICVIQLASRDRIPLLGNTWPALTQTCCPAYVCVLHFCMNMSACLIIFPLTCVYVCLRSGILCLLPDTFCQWSKVTVPLAVTVRYYIIGIWRLRLLCHSADSAPVCVCVCVCVCIYASLPTVLVLTLLVFREASACHRSLGTQRRAGKTHVKIYSHWAWLQESQLAAIWQMTFNRSYCSLCILMSIWKERERVRKTDIKMERQMYRWPNHQMRHYSSFPTDSFPTSTSSLNVRSFPTLKHRPAATVEWLSKTNVTGNQNSDALQRNATIYLNSEPTAAFHRCPALPVFLQLSLSINK